MVDLTGKQLGKWIIERELGRGGMGKVYLAHDEPPAGPDPEATVMQAAVKVLAPELAQDPGFLERFQREIDVLRQLNHPNIIRLYDSGYQDGLYYYSMEYLPGRNFEDVLKERGQLPWKEVLDLALQLCSALKHAHDHGVIHRDIKPQNLLTNDTGLAKLTDFGIAKVFAGKQLTVTGGLVGTAEYLSPEQAAGKRVTGRSDLYSFGVVLYTLLVGHPPFQGRSTLDLMHKHRFSQFDPPQRFVPDLPSDFNKIICDLMEKDPAKRPANGLILLRQLEALRDKMRRREQRTVVSGQAVVDSEQEDEESAVSVGREKPGPATLMSRLIREELAAARRAGPIARFVNQPLVLITLLAACIGVVVYAVWFRKGNETENMPAQEMSEPQRFYFQGLRLYRLGDQEGAYYRWKALEAAYADVDSAQKWVQRAREKLKGFEKVPDPDKRWKDVRAALEQARLYLAQGKPENAEAIWKGLEELYWNDPSALDILKEIQKQRELKNEMKMLPRPAAKHDAAP
jgi:serine/threonine-protein kinase